MKYLWRSFFIFIFLINLFSHSFALQIKNVNYSASNNNDRWMEVFNDGGDIADFTVSDYKVLDSKDSTKHGIFVLKGDNTFPSQSTIFISPSTNIPAGAEKVFRSNYSIDKTSGYISIINADGSTIYSCFNFGGVSCSQDIINENNSTSTATTTNQNSSTTNTQNNTPSTVNTVYVYLPSNNQNKYGDINVLLPNERVVPAGAEADYKVKVTDSQRNLISELDFNWSFGDGGEKFGKNVTHHYVYPGDYILIVTADGYTSGGQARMEVKVVSPDISIQKVGDGKKENFIDIFNNTEYDLFLSDFYLNLDNSFYKFPKNFMIGKKRLVHLSGEAMGFKLPATNISIHFPNKTLLYNYINNQISLASSSTSSTQVFNKDIKIENKNTINIFYKPAKKIYKNQISDDKNEKKLKLLSLKSLHRKKKIK